MAAGRELRELNDELDEQEEGGGEDSLLRPTAMLGTASQLLQRYTKCPVCSSNLHFSHLTDFQRNLTQETARCPECGVRARRVVHKLQ